DRRFIVTVDQALADLAARIAIGQRENTIAVPLGRDDGHVLVRQDSTDGRTLFEIFESHFRNFGGSAIANKRCALVGAATPRLSFDDQPIRRLLEDFSDPDPVAVRPPTDLILDHLDRDALERSRWATVNRDAE